MKIILPIIAIVMGHVLFVYGLLKGSHLTPNEWYMLGIIIAWMGITSLNT